MSGLFINGEYSEDNTFLKLVDTNARLIKKKSTINKQYTLHRLIIIEKLAKFRRPRSLRFSTNSQYAPDSYFNENQLPA